MQSWHERATWSQRMVRETRERKQNVDRQYQEDISRQFDENMMRRRGEDLQRRQDAIHELNKN